MLQTFPWREEKKREQIKRKESLPIRKENKITGRTKTGREMGVNPAGRHNVCALTAPGAHYNCHQINWNFFWSFLLVFSPPVPRQLEKSRPSRVNKASPPCMALCMRNSVGPFPPPSSSTNLYHRSTGCSSFFSLFFFFLGGGFYCWGSGRLVMKKKRTEKRSPLVRNAHHARSSL